MSNYKYQKERYKILERTRLYEERFNNSIMNMFVYEGPEELPFEFFYNLEKYLINDGECAIVMPVGNDLTTWYIAHADRVPSVNGLDVYGEGLDLLTTTDNGKSEIFLDFHKNEKVVYCRNNYTAEYDGEITRYASFLAEIDKSILHNVLNCRLSPLINVSTRAQKKEVEAALENNDTGKVRTITGLVDPLGGGENIPTVINYNDVQNIDKVQYLTTLHENIERWFYSMYGLSTSGSTKMAQQSVDEVNNAENIARILPDVKLEMRQAFLKELEEKSGVTISITLNDAWKKERAELTTPDSEGLLGQPETEETVEEGGDNAENPGSAGDSDSVGDMGAEVVKAVEELKDKAEEVEELLGVSAEAAKEYEEDVEA